VNPSKREEGEEKKREKETMGRAFPVAVLFVVPLFLLRLLCPCGAQTTATTCTSSPCLPREGGTLVSEAAALSASGILGSMDVPDASFYFPGIASTNTRLPLPGVFLQHSIEVSQAGTVTVAYLHETAGYRNLFGLFEFVSDAGSAGGIRVVREITVFPDISSTCLAQFDAVEVGPFPAGTKLGFVMGQNARCIGPNATKFYSFAALNPRAEEHFSMFRDKHTGHLVVGFEDLALTGTTTGYGYRDGQFVVFPSNGAALAAGGPAPTLCWPPCRSNGATCDFATAQCVCPAGSLFGGPTCSTCNCSQKVAAQGCGASEVAGCGPACVSPDYSVDSLSFCQPCCRYASDSSCEFSACPAKDMASDAESGGAVGIAVGVSVGAAVVAVAVVVAVVLWRRNSKRKAARDNIELPSSPLPASPGSEYGTPADSPTEYSDFRDSSSHSPEYGVLEGGPSPLSGEYRGIELPASARGGSEYEDIEDFVQSS
jgi:hypothetical protein